MRHLRELLEMIGVTVMPTQVSDVQMRRRRSVTDGELLREEDRIALQARRGGIGRKSLRDQSASGVNQGWRKSG